MSSSRIEALKNLLNSRPNDSRLRFGLALEYLNAGQLEDGVRELRAYLADSEDEGNAWGRLGEALRALGEDEQAREAYRAGIDAASRHGHPTMAGEFEDVLSDWDS